MKVLVTGSSGLVGSYLVQFLTDAGWEVYKLVRVKPDLANREIAWDPHRGVISPPALEKFDAVINLAGENLGSVRWTEEKKRRILNSRVQATYLLCDALAQLKNPPKVLISASAVGIYGNRGDEILTEASSPGRSFLSDVCQQWEAATENARTRGIRVVNLRIGMVLSTKGGALKQILMPFKLGLGGILGDGKQYMSWIAIDDLVKAIQFCLDNPSLLGPVNAVSPNPITNETFTKTLGEVLHRPTFMRVPAMALKLTLGQMADELLLASARVIPEELLNVGFTFYYPEIGNALRHLLKK